MVLQLAGVGHSTRFPVWQRKTIRSLICPTSTSSRGLFSPPSPSFCPERRTKCVKVGLPNANRIHRPRARTKAALPMTRTKPRRPKPPQGQSDTHRRTYTKSRNGCIICKRRRVKCDETRPRCRKCEYGNRPCAYEASEDKSPGSTTSAPVATPESSSGHASWASSSLSLGNVGAGAGHSGLDGEFCGPGSFQFIHMKLLHHAHTHLDQYLGKQGDNTPIIDIVMVNAERESYGLDQLLALSALHLSTRPNASPVYAQQATELQTRALSSFSKVRGGVSDDNYLKVFLFSTLLGIHVLHDSLAISGQDLSSFIQKFVDYMWLHRGVRAVIKNHWGLILESPLKPILEISQLYQKVDHALTGEETSSLSNFLTAKCDITSPQGEACLSALRWVQWNLDLIKLYPDRPEVPRHCIVAWPIVVAEDYVEAMCQHRPEAFAVFAYWCALVHRYRDFWVLEQGGSELVKMIARHIGPYWAEALWWPLSEVDEDDANAPATGLD